MPVMTTTLALMTTVTHTPQITVPTVHSAAHLMPAVNMFVYPMVEILSVKHIRTIVMTIIPTLTTSACWMPVVKQTV